MKLKKFITLVITATLTLTSLPVYAEDTEPVKYENDVYRIGDDIPEDTYILISEDNTKPSYYGIFYNAKGKNGQFNIADIVKNPQEYYLPNLFYNYDTNLLSGNYGQQNSLISHSYFDNNTVLNLNRDDNSNSRNDFLYLENCYAVSLQDIDKANLDICNYGYAPVKGNLGSKEYKITLSKDKGGTLIFYKYNKNSKELETISSYTLTTQKIEYPIKDLYQDSTFVTVPKNADLVFKSGVNICDMSGNIIYADKDISHSDNFTEKYNFADVSTALKTRVMQYFQALSKEQKVIRNAKVPGSYIKSGAQSGSDVKAVYKALTDLPKNDAEKEYIRYVREMYVLYSQNNYIDSVLSKYLYNATSFKDIDYAAREVVHNSASNYGIIMNSNYIRW